MYSGLPQPGSLAFRRAEGNHQRTCVSTRRLNALQVTAVQHELLANYTDVVVFPTKGPCSLASKLAGGGTHTPIGVNAHMLIVFMQTTTAVRRIPTILIHCMI